MTKDFDLDLDDPQKRLWLWLRLTTMDLAPQLRSSGLDLAGIGFPLVGLVFAVDEADGA